MSFGKTHAYRPDLAWFLGGGWGVGGWGGVGGAGWGVGWWGVGWGVVAWGGGVGWWGGVVGSLGRNQPTKPVPSN